MADRSVVSKTKHSKTKTEAGSTQISKTKHPKLENEAPKSRKRSTQTRKRSTHPKLATCLPLKTKMKMMEEEALFWSQAITREQFLSGSDLYHAVS